MQISHATERCFVDNYQGLETVQIGSQEMTVQNTQMFIPSLLNPLFHLFIYPFLPASW